MGAMGSSYEKIAKHEVLIVDDFQEIIDVLSPLITDLDGRSYNIDSAVTIQEAIDKLAKKEYDIILLDLYMPDNPTKDPLYIVKKAYSLTKRSVIIVLTGMYPDLGMEAIKEGAKDFLIKGNLSLDKLKEAFKNALEIRRQIKRIDSTESRFTDLCHIAGQVEKIVKGQKS